MRFAICLIYLSTLLVAGPALAQDCGEASSQSSLNECANRALKKTDAALNAAYKEISGRLRDDRQGKGRLVAAQRAWIAFRDAECNFSTGNTVNGSIHPMLALQCHDALTKARLEQLKAYLACKEGDLTCPVPAN